MEEACNLSCDFYGFLDERVSLREHCTTAATAGMKALRDEVGSA
jgi:uncharacterized lipoprotein NlpE involved in copper resistance